MLVKNFVKKIWEKKLKAFVNKNIYLLKIYIQKTVSVKKNLGPAQARSFFAHFWLYLRRPSCHTCLSFVLVRLASFLRCASWCQRFPPPLCRVRRLHHVAGVFHVFVVIVLSFSCSGDPRPPWTPLELQTKKIPRGSANANEFHIGIQLMGATQKGIVNLNKFVFWEKHNFFANKFISIEKEKCLFFALNKALFFLILRLYSRKRRRRSYMCKVCAWSSIFLT